ncbi:hypothetical protein [Luteolibacter sp. Populi]|uniref:hypothetical protein n=1 Tax=Luteolibacter sp. Populi TaxID=3230487 RepID=UPI003465B3D2
MNEMECQFLEEIRSIAKGLKRVRFPDLCIAFGKVFPALTGLDQRRRMHELLHSLRAGGKVMLPTGRVHFDCVSEPHLPRWIQLVLVETRVPRPALDSADFPWTPALSFAATLRNPQQLDVVRRVHEFLAAGGAARCMVPIKERSVELFGDEKKLDVIRKSVLFRSGRLSLPLLRCYQVTPPLVWERGPQQKEGPVFIVENHSAFDSCVRWNAERCAWAAVAYGSGTSFEASAPFLQNIVTQVQWDGRLLYFGDLDPKGLIIPVRASSALVEVGLPAVSPHFGCYCRLLERAEGADLPRVGTLAIPLGCVDWLGPALADRVAEWFGQGIRIPQELVGYEQLAFGACSDTSSGQWSGAL